MHEDQNLALRTVCGWCKPLSFRSSFHQPAEDMSYYKSCLLSALEAPELCPDVSGKQDPPDTCEPQTSAADKLPPGRGGVQSLAMWSSAFRQISDQKVVVLFHFWSSTLSFTSPREQLLPANAWKGKKKQIPAHCLLPSPSQEDESGVLGQNWKSTSNPQDVNPACGL